MTTGTLLLQTAREAGHLAGALGVNIARADAWVTACPDDADALRKGLREVSEYAARVLAEYETPTESER